MAILSLIILVNYDLFSYFIKSKITFPGLPPVDDTLSMDLTKPDLAIDTSSINLTKPDLAIDSGSSTIT